MNGHIEIFSDVCRAYYHPDAKKLVITEKPYRHPHKQAVVEIWNIDEQEARSLVSRVHNIQ